MPETLAGKAPITNILRIYLIERAPISFKIKMASTVKYSHSRNKRCSCFFFSPIERNSAIFINEKFLKTEAINYARNINQKSDYEYI